MKPEQQAIFDTVPERLFQSIRASDEGGCLELLTKAKEAGHDLNAFEERGGQTLLMVAARQGHVPLMKLLLEQGVAVDAQNGTGMTALHIAAWKGHYDAVSCLLQAGGEWFIQDLYGRNALMTAALRGDLAVVKLLLEHAVRKQPLLIEMLDNNDFTALGHAVREGHADVCEALVMEGWADFRDVTRISSTGESFSQIAEGHGHRECITLFEEWSARVDEVVAAVKKGAELAEVKPLLSKAPPGVICWTFDNDSLLTMAVKASRVDVARLLLERMAGSPSSDGILSSVKEALYEAVVIEQVEMVSVLLEAASACGTHVNELYYDADKVTYTVRRTLLGCAAEHNHVRAVKRLLQEKGMKVDAKDSQGRTPLNLASCNGHAETVKVLLEAGADTTLQYDHDGLSSEEVKGAIDAVDEQIRQLSEACSSGRVEEVATMLASHPQLVNGRRADQRRQTVLMLAAGAGQGDVVRLLLEKGADAKLVHNGRQTALMLAAAGGHVEVAAMLLDAAGGCEIDAADNLHRTAFCRACEGGHVEVVKLLLEKGARHEVSGAEDEDDWSFRHEPFRHECRPLVVASQIGNLALVNLLLELPWEGSTTDASLREASQHLHVEVVTALLHKLERVSVKSFASALREAARQGSMELFTALVTNVASDMDAMKMCLSIAVHAAYDEGQVEMMEALLRAGAAIDPYLLERFEEQYGVPVQSLEDLLAAREHLVETVREGHLQAASQLMEEYGRQALMNTAVPGGSWPLVAAIEAGREESVQWLMENGAWLSETKYPWVQRAEQAHADRLCEVGDEEHIERQCGTAELCLACEHGHLGIVKYLIEEKGADPRGEGPFGSPLALAAEGGYLLVVQHLLQIGKQSVDGLNQALKAACREGYRRCALLLLRAGLEREYVLAKACSIHAAATVVPPCLTARAAEGLVPLPSVEVAAPAQAEGGGQGGQGKKRGRENERGGWSLEVVCEVARFVGEALKADLQMELMEMLMPGEEEATRLVEAARQEEAATDDEDSMDDA